MRCFFFQIEVPLYTDAVQGILIETEIPPQNRGRTCGVFNTDRPLSLRLQDLLGPVTRVKKKFLRLSSSLLLLQVLATTVLPGAFHTYQTPPQHDRVVWYPQACNSRECTPPPTPPNSSTTGPINSKRLRGESNLTRVMASPVSFR